MDTGARIQMQFHSSFLPFCAADGATSLGLEEILECCSSFPVSHGNYELQWVLSVCFPHISLRIFLAFCSNYFDLTCPSSINVCATRNSHIKPFNSPRIYKEFLFSKQKRFNCTPIYEYHTAESQSQETV